MQFTNDTGISLAMAVWLLHDEYRVDRPGNAKEVPVISATTILKPTKQILLGMRVPYESRTMDVSALISSSFGTAMHDSIEKAWTKGYRTAMLKLGYPQSVVDRVVINPHDHEIKHLRETGKDPFPVYLEQRYERVINGIAISGKFDMILNGELNDTKSTSAWSYKYGTKDEDHQLQMSIYRWINPDKVTSDVARIQYIFTDWQKSQAKMDPAYPQSRLQEKTLPLLSIADTEKWMLAKLHELRTNEHLPEDRMVPCSDKDLWRSPPQYKYYTDPAKATIPGSRATKNFKDDLAEAKRYLAEAGKGIVITVPGQVKACSYCAAFDICKQKDQYDHE